MNERLLLIAGACVILLSLESIVPLYRFRRSRFRHALPNVSLAAIVVVMNMGLAFLSTGLSSFVLSRNIGLLFLIALPDWAKALAGIVVLDLSAWVAHVAMHKSKWGWRFHRVHHSEVAVDVTTAFRQHPGETVWRHLCLLPAIAAFGIAPWMIAVYLTIAALNAQVEHANLAIAERADRLLRLLFVTPDMHKVHHSCHPHETDSNYANLFSFWDRVFGTYTARVDFGSLRYGLEGLNARETGRLSRLLLMPFAPSDRLMG